MKVTVGFGEMKDALTLQSAGADELFCGYVPQDWLRLYGNVLPLNRRETLYSPVQVGTAEDMKILGRLSREYGLPISAAFNSLYYTPQQLPLIAGYIEELASYGITEFIASDVNLICYLTEHKVACKLHLSGELGEMNTKTLDFLMENFGGGPCRITRIIFHRKMTVEGMKRCTKHSRERGYGLEFEAFLMNERCHFTGGYCNSLHCDELAPLCRLEYRAVALQGQKTSMQNTADKAMEDRPEYVPGQTGCGLCALERLQQAGITHLKLVGRGEALECMLEDLRLTKEALKMLENGENPGEVHEKGLFNRDCSGNCYYPREEWTDKRKVCSEIE